MKSSKLGKIKPTMRDLQHSINSLTFFFRMCHKQLQCVITISPVGNLKKKHKHQCKLNQLFQYLN